MSTLKTNNAQIGQSATASNNFTWYQPTVPDGTVRLGQGNSGATTSDILVVSSTGLAIGGSSIPAERIVVGTAQATTSGTAVGFTGLPSWVKRITAIYTGVTSTSASANRTFQLGTSSGYATSGYVATVAQQTSGSTGYSVTTTTYFQTTTTTPNSCSGTIVFTLQGSNVWSISGVSSQDGQAYYVSTVSGYVTLSGTLDRIQFTGSGAGTFNGGTINIIYEG